MPRLLAKSGILSCTLIALSAIPAGAQTFCVVPPDTSWRPVNFGFELHTAFRTEEGRVVDRSYPVLRGVSPNSAADSAGLRDGDILVAVNGFDVLKRRDSARTKGPGVPTRMAIRRGDSTFERTIVGVAAPGCKSGRGSEPHTAGGDSWRTSASRSHDSP